MLLTKSKVITAIILVLSVVGFVFGMYAGVRCGIIDEFVLILLKKLTARDIWIIVPLNLHL